MLYTEPQHSRPTQGYRSQRLSTPIGDGASFPPVPSQFDAPAVHDDQRIGLASDVASLAATAGDQRRPQAHGGPFAIEYPSLRDPQEGSWTTTFIIVVTMSVLAALLWSVLRAT
jgi:hypothetical protein